MADDIDDKNLNTTQADDQPQAEADSSTSEDHTKIPDTDSSNESISPKDEVEEEVLGETEMTDDSTQTNSGDQTIVTEEKNAGPADPSPSAQDDSNKTSDDAVTTDADADSTPSDSPADDEPAHSDSPVAGASDPSEAGRWYVVHTYAGHENKVLTNLKQRIESEHLEHKIFDILVPTQDKIEIRGGKKEQVKEKIFPGYILVKMILDDSSWLVVRTTQGVTSFVGMGNKPTPISETEVKSIVQFMSQGASPTFKDVFLVDDTVKIIDGPFAEFIGKVDSVDKEKGKVRVLVSIFGRETPVELDFLQVQKL
jgi:transcription termination/antitermination protein NusG